jgi:hypothetical protein
MIPDDNNPTAVAAPPSAPAAPGTGTSLPAAAAATAPAPAAAPPAAATTAAPVIKPVKRGGLAGIVDEFRDAIAGTTTNKIGTDDQGNKYIQKVDLTGRQKWMRIVGDVLRGAAAGAANGQGPGGKARALQAGIDVGDKQAQQQKQQDKDQQEEVKQDQLEKFNAVKLKHDLAAQEFTLQRLKVRGTQEDIDFAQKQIDREHQLGSADLGTYKDEADLARVQQAHPEFWKSVYANNIVAVPELNDKGERQGIRIFLRTPGVGSQPVEPGTPIKVFTPGKKPTDPPTLTEQVPTIPMTHDMVDAYNNAALTKYNDYFKNKGEQELKKSEVQKNKAGAARDLAEAGKLKAETPEAGASTKGLTGPDFIKALPADRQSLLEDVRSGRMAPENLNRMLSGKDGQKLLTDLAAAYPNEIDTSRLAAYPATYKDFTSGKTAQTMTNLNSALKTIHELKALNTYSSRLPTGGARNAFDNKLVTVSAEVANALAKPGATATKDEIENVRKSLSTTFSRDKAIDTQVDSLVQQYTSLRDRWNNAAPSAVYEANMPDIGQKARQVVRQSDPDLANRIWGKPVIVNGATVGYTKDPDGKTMEPVERE